ncbi:MAG: hypothetical protein U1C33_06715 [Candidatus Cloacimonadaceae bacterium]|nr:hypothetical protein [Candidatus Cloacimonadaceae bacterium]
MTIRRIALLLLCGGLLLIGSCFMGSSILFLESDAVKNPNLIVNPSFETKASDKQILPKGWFLMGGSRDKAEVIVCDTTTYVSGKQSLKIQGTENTVMIVSDAFRIEGQAGYFIKGSARSNSDYGPQVKIRFVAYSEAGTIRNTFTKRIRTSHEWHKGSISAGFLKSDVHFGRVLIIIPPTDEEPVWIDDIGAFQVHHFPID